MIVIISGLLPYIYPNIGNISVLRCVRLFRPLMTIQSIPGLKTLIGVIFKCIPDLFNTVSILVVFFFIYGIAGVQMFSGKLHQRCYAEVSNSTTSTSMLLARVDKYDVMVYHPIEEEGKYCSMDLNQGRQCPNGLTCLQIAENPMYGYVGFDNIWQAWLTLFVNLTMEGWTDGKHI